MSRLLVVVLLVIAFVSIAAPVAGQDDRGWETTQRCVAPWPDTRVPMSEWDFDGVIFTQDDQGVHAMRTDVPTPYFVAFETERGFTRAGSFSPDGRWFAYPVGVVQHRVNSMGSDLYGIDWIQVVDTSPYETFLQRIPWSYHEFELPIAGQPYRLISPRWIDREHITYPTRGINADVHELANALTGEIVEWTGETSLEVLVGLAPDSTRAIYYNFWSGDVNPPMVLYDLEQDEPIVEIPTGTGSWLPDSSGFIQVFRASSGAEQLTLFSRDGDLLEVVAIHERFSRFAASDDGRWLAFSAGQQLFIADLGAKTVTDVCVTLESVTSGFVWSPDGATLAFVNHGFPVLLNMATLDVHILDYQTEYLRGWYALDES